MRSYILRLLPLIIVAGGICLSILPQWSTPAEKPDAVAAIDFDALHRQASDALDALRRAQNTQASPAVF